MTTLASIMNMAGPDMFIILLIVLVLFGAKKLPGLARGMGQAVSEFHKGRAELGQQFDLSGEARLKDSVKSAAVTEEAAAASPAGTKSTV